MPYYECSDFPFNFNFIFDAALDGFVSAEYIKDGIYICNFILLVNCLWNEFGPWSNCTEECDGGTQTRVRTIQQEAAYGGMTCQGYATESRNCNEEPCQRMYLLKDVICIQKSEI